MSKGLQINDTPRRASFKFESEPDKTQIIQVMDEEIDFNELYGLLLTNKGNFYRGKKEDPWCELYTYIEDEDEYEDRED